jgi:hypothetical protein
MDRDRDAELWRQLLGDGLNYEAEGGNARLPFRQMSQRYGKAWIAYLRAAWNAKDEMPESEFRRLNGEVPEAFVEKNLR